MSRKNRKVSSESLNISAAQKAYVRKHLLLKRKIRIYQYLLLIVFIAFWEISTHIGIVDPFIFSSPLRVMKTIAHMTIDGQLLYHIGITLLETLVSFALVNIVGLIIATLLWWNDSLSKVLEPYLIVLNSLPKSALAPVFIVWLGANMKTIIVSRIGCVIRIIITLYSDFKAVEEDRLN